HGCGFPGPVWPEKAVNLAALHPEAQVGHGLMGSVHFGKVLNFNQAARLLFRDKAIIGPRLKSNLKNALRLLLSCRIIMEKSRETWRLEVRQDENSKK